MKQSLRELAVLAAVAAGWSALLLLPLLRLSGELFQPGGGTAAARAALDAAVRSGMAASFRVRAASFGEALFD